ncbi:MAG TPA: hypothetical protein VHZ03_38670 [Trebonia sp.]|nr:hypothetical protein [Trebonia sp.]
MPGLLGELGYGLLDRLRGEQLREPVIDVSEHVGLPDVDGLGVVDAVGQGVLGGEPAPVVDLTVVHLGAHLPAAQPAMQDAAQRVGTRPAMGLVLGLAATPGEHRLGMPEIVLVDDLRVGGLVGADPLVFWVPPLLGGVAERDVLDVEQDFVGALPVPHLVTGVAGVAEDRADGALRPGDAVPVGVAFRVVRGRAGDAVTREAFGDGEDAAAGDELGEDPLNHGSRLGIEGELVHPLPVCRLGGVGVRSRVHEQVAVRRAPAEEPPLDLRLGGHRGADADLDPVALAFAHPAEHRHHEVVRFVGGVDGAADFGHPQRDAVVVEDGEGESVLVAIERAVRLADHHGVKCAGRVLEFTEQRGCHGAALPGDRA